MLPSTSQHCCGPGGWRPSNSTSCSGSWRRTRRSSTPTLTRKPKSFSTEKNNGFSDMTRRQQGLWASCHSCRACPCASPRPCPNSNPGACSRTPADSYLGGAWPKKTFRPSQLASSRSWCSKNCRHASLCRSPARPGNTAQVSHRGSLAFARLCNIGSSKPTAPPLSPDEVFRWPAIMLARRIRLWAPH